jgi:uncharacterized protein (TIGR00251 family)
MERTFHFHDGKRGVALAVRVTPRARRNEVSAILEDGTVKIRLTAPPVEGKANAALVRFLADILEIPESKVEIVAGQSGRDKLITLMDVDGDTVQARLQKQLHESC